MQENFEPFITKDSLNHSNLNSEILKPRFHLEPIKQLIEKGCVSKDAEESMQSLMSRLVSKKEERTKKNGEKKKKISKSSTQPTLSYLFNMKSATYAKDSDKYLSEQECSSDSSCSQDN
jgi:hypothetical protein